MAMNARLTHPFILSWSLRIDDKKGARGNGKLCAFEKSALNPLCLPAALDNISW
jgi:hypothetical protein